MGVRVLHCQNHGYSTSNAVLYCSTTDWAFGPVFYDSEEYEADERAHAFLRWLGAVRDPRQYTDSELESKYSEWLAQEKAQWATEEKVTEDE